MKFQQIILDKNANESTAPANHSIQVLKNKLTFIRYLTLLSSSIQLDLLIFHFDCFKYAEISDDDLNQYALVSGDKRLNYHSQLIISNRKG